MEPTKKISQKKEVIENNNLSKNLLILMEENDVSESELSRALDIPYNTIKRIVQGITYDPRLSTLQAIANHFQVGIDALTGSDNPLFSCSSEMYQRSVPILKWDDISDPDFLNKIDKSNIENFNVVKIPYIETISEEAYGLTSKKSMQYRFPIGTIFIVEPNYENKPEDGDLVLVRFIDNNAVSIRELIIDPPNWQLIPIVEHSPILLYNEKKHKIIGIVIMAISQCKLK